MRRSVAGRACALSVVLALLLAPLLPGAAAGAGCSACPPGCPMHAHHLGCHRSTSVSCHKAAPAPGIRTACDHARDPFTGGPAPVRGIIPPQSGTSASFAATDVEHPALALTSRPLPEPPTGPPRASAA